MAHYSIKDFLDDGVTNTADEKSETKSAKSRRGNGGSSDKGVDGGTGADVKQEDTNTKPDGSSDAKTKAVAKGRGNGNRRKSSSTSTKSSK